MKYASFFLLPALLGLSAHPQACAQSAREQSEAMALYRQANAAPTETELRAALQQPAAGALGDGKFQFGTLLTFDGHRLLVPGLRYFAGLHLLEVQDSLNIDQTHLWPAGSLRGFDIGEAGDRTQPLRRFRSRLVKESGSPRPEFVEVLTTIDAGPLLLAWLYAPSAAGQPLTRTLVAGPGTPGGDPLRPLEPTQAAVLRLFGSRSKDVRTFAEDQRLDYTQPGDIARMMNHYNRVAVVK